MTKLQQYSFVCAPSMAQIAGAAVTLLGEDGAALANVVTGADGGYAFTGLASGTYTVRFPQDPAGDGLVFTAPDLGDDATDSDADPATGAATGIFVTHDVDEAIFLAEAFTRPKVMKRLAKLGFNQSYSYFTWRNTKHEMQAYLTELTTEECRHTMRPNFFVNTPDINPHFLQQSGRPGFRTRLVLAASLGGNYGVYNGFEICEATPFPGKEEYLDSEKYQLRDWDFDQEGHIKDDIRLMNDIRRSHPAMRDFLSLRFFPAYDDAVIYYGKFDRTHDSYLLFHVLMDPHGGREFDFEVPMWEFGLPDEASIEVQDLIHGNHFTWHGKSHRLALDPQSRPYAIWRLFPPGGARA